MKRKEFEKRSGKMRGQRITPGLHRSSDAAGEPHRRYAALGALGVRELWNARHTQKGDRAH